MRSCIITRSQRHRTYAYDLTGSRIDIRLNAERGKAADARAIGQQGFYQYLLFQLPLQIYITTVVHTGHATPSCNPMTIIK